MLGHRTLNVEDYLTILKRRWWIIALPAIALAIVGIAITFYVAPKYTSQTLVLINQPKVPEDLVRSVVSEDLNSRLSSMREQIESRASLKPIVEKYNLYDPAHMDMDARIAMARTSLDIQPIRSGNGLAGFKIFFTASDPQTAQQVCQEITSLFTDANVRLRGESARNTTNFLKEQVEQQKATLDEQDQKMAAFKRQYVGMLPEDTPNNTNLLTTLSSRLDAVSGQLESYQQSKTMTEAALATQQQSFGTSTPSSPTHTPAAQEKELEMLQAQEADLSLHYEDKYPALVRTRGRIAELQKQMAHDASMPPAPVAAAPVSPRAEPASIQDLRTRIRLIDSAIAKKRQEQDQIEGQIRQYQGKIQSTPQVEEQEKELTRGYETTLEAYNALKKKLDESQMATDLEQRQQGETFSLVDAANLPESPTFPKRSQFGGGGFAAGLLIGLMIVALLEYKDTALRSERDVWAFTQLPTLAVIAWTNETPQSAGGSSRLARLFRRKSATNELADAPG